MDLGLTDKVVFVAGASRGIGAAIALGLAARGYDVALNDIDRQKTELESVAAQIRAAGQRALCLYADVSDKAQVEAMVAQARTDLGEIDAVVNNAGISPKGPEGERLDTISTDLRTWGHVFHVNFFAPVVLARGLIDELSAAKGAVVNVTSIAGSRVHPFAGAAYATSKAALAALTREMAHDFGPAGVRVNAIAPGEVETGILSEGTDKIVETLPLRRLGQPSEVAEAIYFLCTEASSYVSGTEIEVNGAQHV